MSQLPEKDRNFLKLWQKLSNDRNQAPSLSEKANLLRKQGMLIANAECQGLDVRYLLHGLNDEYESIVDFDETRKTLNSYADDILALAGTKKVDSSEWKTSIDADSLKNMPCFKDLLRSDKVVPENKTLTECFEGLSTISVEIPPMPNVRRENSEPTSCLVSPKKSQVRFDKQPEVEFIEECKKVSPPLPSNGRKFCHIFEPKRKHSSNENEVKNKREKTNRDEAADNGGGFKTDNEELERRMKESINQRVYKSATQKTNRDEAADNGGGFKTGNEELERRMKESINQRVYKSATQQPNLLCHLYGTSSKNLGGVRQNFKIPISQNETSTVKSDARQPTTPSPVAAALLPSSASSSPTVVMDEEFKGLDPDLVTIIQNDILELKSNVSWDSIAGLTSEKLAIKEMVLWPLLRPDLFHGIRAPPKGLLLFGPPGTGKTLIGRCIASQAKATFFNISASSLTSKWVGEGEKLVRTLFEVARRRLPAVIFIDEVDSLLSQRSENEHESSRRIKTEFLQQLDGAKTNAEDLLLLVGATNRPQELDTAARRRFTRRIYIPLPDKSSRSDIIARLLNGQKHNLTIDQIEKIAELTENYSCADVSNLCKEAAIAPLRGLDNIEDICLDDVPPISYEHFEKAVRVMGSSVSQNDLNILKNFNENFGYNNRE